MYGITVNYVRMSSGEALARVEAEKDAPTFDIWWGGPIDSFVAAKEMESLQAYDLPNYVNLRDPDLRKDPENSGQGVLIGTLGFATDTNWLARDSLVLRHHHWTSLKPEFTDQVMVAHPLLWDTALPTHPPGYAGEHAGWDISQYASQESIRVHQSVTRQFVGQGERESGIVFCMIS